MKLSGGFSNHPQSLRPRRPGATLRPSGGGRRVLYITSTRLMRESEDAVRAHASSGDEAFRRVCSQLLANEPRYGEWHALHEAKMRNVASPGRRDPQVQALRAVAVEQVHRTALVNYLRQGRITGGARERALSLFHGISDVRDATLAEHRTYLLAASTQVCAHDLLELVGDDEGLGLIRRYELAYTQFFGMFCERAIAQQTGRNYLLGSLLPEVKGVADRLRLQIVGARLKPVEPRRAAGGVVQGVWLSRKPARAVTARDHARAALPTAAQPVSRSARSRTAR